MDCPFCTIPDFVCKETPVWCIGIEPPQSNHYSKYTQIKLPHLEKHNFVKMSTFTPGSRLALSLNDATQLIAHRQAWNDIYNGLNPYGIIFDNSEDLANTTLRFRIENLSLPKDWDMIKLSSSQYVMNKRAATVLLQATIQYHQPLDDLIRSLIILKVYDLNGVLAK